MKPIHGKTRKTIAKTIADGYGFIPNISNIHFLRNAVKPRSEYDLRAVIFRMKRDGQLYEPNPETFRLTVEALDNQHIWDKYTVFNRKERVFRVHTPEELEQDYPEYYRDEVQHDHH